MPQDELWSRLRDFEIDDPGAQYPLSARLQKENRWSSSRVTQLTEEYKKFLYLACTQDMAVTPSDAVDKVWHQHMLYSRHYWDLLCEKILKRNLHHEPSKGGKKEDARCAEQYKKTLEAYERVFGQSPPKDIWPRPKGHSIASHAGVAKSVRSGLLNLLGVYVVSSSTALFAASQVDVGGYRSSDLSAGPFVIVGFLLLGAVIMSQLFRRADGECFAGVGCVAADCGGCGGGCGM